MELSYASVRDQICDVCHKMWQMGWAAANDGNVSVKVGDNIFLATPTGISKSLVKPEMLVVIDKDDQLLEDGHGYRPSSEIKMHLRCYAERDDVMAVVHAHPPIATGFAVAGVSLDTYSMIETVLGVGNIPIAPYATPSTQEVPDSIAPFLKDHDTLLLANHGALAVGQDLTTAYYHMETLEMFAKISLVAHLLGGARELTSEQIQRLLDLRVNGYHLKGHHPGFQHLDDGLSQLEKKG